MTRQKIYLWQLSLSVILVGWLMRGGVVHAVTCQPGSTATTCIVCKDTTFSGSRLTFQSGIDPGPSVQKVISNCVFKDNLNKKIQITSGENILIENSRFENIRTNVPGQDGGTAIHITGSGLGNDIIIRNNFFTRMSSDGIQLGRDGNNINRVDITDNEFIGDESWGENAVDVKGVKGPILIARNYVHGFRPCTPPQDCSGDHGQGVTIHDGGISGQSQNVTVDNNEFANNTIGLGVVTSHDHIVLNNYFHDNLTFGLNVRSVNGIQIQGNRFQTNSQHLNVTSDVTNCTRSANNFTNPTSPGNWGPCQQGGGGPTNTPAPIPTSTPTPRPSPTLTPSTTSAPTPTSTPAPNLKNLLLRWFTSTTDTDGIINSLDFLRAFII